MVSKWKLKEGQWLGGQIEMIYDQFVFKTNIDEWNYLSDFINCMRACFARPVPERIMK